MSDHINRLAPDIPQTLTPEVEEGVREMLRTHQMNPYATRDGDCIRRVDSPQDKGTPLRPAFLHDIEKIIHLPAYNRMNGKTQVFAFVENDDLTRRGLHVQLVARTARDIGRALGLILDLIEAIGLSHDLGHTPFGHAGEHFLNDIYHERTGRWFMHNVQSVRVMDVLYGRNLALQTLDGALCHNGEFERQKLKMSGLTSFEEFDEIVERCWDEGPKLVKTLRPMTAEGCVVRLSDIIAYVGKDRQDAIRVGLVNEDTFDDGLGSAYNAWALRTFIADIVNNSFGKPQICMSEEGFHELSRAKSENLQKIEMRREVDGRFSDQIRDLFHKLYMQELDVLQRGDTSGSIFRHHIEPLTRELSFYGRTYDWQRDFDQTVVDYISSMTDNYFIASCERLFPETTELFQRRSYFHDL
ncbi:MAG: deoxyguanosinetriphosphate triphosphohydrolase family protein [Coriobacteriaceae bacterium]